MKRLLPLLTALLLLCPAARAEIVGRAGNDYIHQWTAPSGQPLYFVSAEQEPYVRMEDVNFDGMEDVVATTLLGARNFGAVFFVWDGEAYVPVTLPGEEVLMNYTLHPQLGLVETLVSEGPGGVMSTRKIWRWKGTELELMRTASGSEVTEMTVEGDIVTTATDRSLVRLRVWDNLTSMEANGVIGPALLMDMTIDFSDEDTLHAATQAMDEFIWDGLLP